MKWTVEKKLDFNFSHAGEIKKWQISQRWFCSFRIPSIAQAIHWSPFAHGAEEDLLCKFWGQDLHYLHSYLETFRSSSVTSRLHAIAESLKYHSMSLICRCIIEIWPVWMACTIVSYCSILGQNLEREPISQLASLWLYLRNAASAALLLLLLRLVRWELIISSLLLYGSVCLWFGRYFLAQMGLMTQQVGAGVFQWFRPPKKLLPLTWWCSWKLP